MKKHLTVIAVCMLVLILLSSCSPKTNNTQSLLYSKGLELIQKMDMMAESDEYVSLVNPTMEISDIIKDIGDNNYSKPKSVYKVTVPKEAVSFIFMDEERFNKLPEEMKKELEKRSIKSIPTRINAQQGSTSFAATSLFTLEDSFIDDIENNTLFVYLFEDEYLAMVTFIPGNENIVGASASFVISDSLSQINSDSELATWVAEKLYLKDCEVEEIKIAK